MYFRLFVLSASLLTISMTTGEAFASDDIDNAIQSLRSVKPGSIGAASARKGLITLRSAGPQQLLPLLKAFRGADPLAANWLRNAFDTAASSELSEGRRLPQEELLALVSDRSQSPTARRLAYEWLLRQSPELEDQVIPDMLMDPSPEFRRDAVARLIEQAKSANDADTAAKTYAEAMKGVVHEDQVKEISKALKAAGQPVDVQGHFGFLASWKIIGPFDNKDEKGFSAVYPPETEINLDAEYDGQSDKVKWQAITTEDDFGVVDIAKQLENYKGSLMYATTTFTNERERDVEIRLGTPNAWKLWVNGEQVFEREEYHRSSQMDQYKVEVHLKEGPNTILIKVCQNEQKQEWAQRYQFQVRVCDATGVGIPQVVKSAEVRKQGARQ
ncbi:MAG: hypothetical protein KDA91_15770 [Planctomycetaceae bacterium]|nr:hypothetical protein [Planctomycetaceae bacterium]